MDAKNRIVETASRLFYKQGYNSTGINQIIKEAEVAKASLYQYFPSKEDLLAEYLKITAAGTSQTLQSIASKYKTPKEKVLAIFDYLTQSIRHAEFNGCNFLNILSEMPAENNTIKTLIKKQKNSIRSLFSSILKPIAKENLADEMYLLFDAALIASKVHGDPWPAKSARKMAERML